jgi:cytochrome P450
VLQRVAADPSRIPNLVEEGLRYDSPVQVVFRKTTTDTELRGVRIPKGDYVGVFLGSANRDERRFADPDRLDLDRDARPASRASASASTSAWARRSRGSRRAWRSRRSCPSS